MFIESQAVLLETNSPQDLHRSNRNTSSCPSIANHIKFPLTVFDTTDTSLFLPFVVPKASHYPLLCPCMLFNPILWEGQRNFSHREGERNFSHRKKIFLIYSHSFTKILSDVYLKSISSTLFNKAFIINMSRDLLIHVFS